MNLKFGKTLKKIRSQSHLSQKFVSDIINCSRGTYSCWEQDIGEIPLSKLFLLLNYLKIPFNDFFKEVASENNIKYIAFTAIDNKEAFDVKSELEFIANRISSLRKSF